MAGRASERGAALIAVMAMVLLLSGLAMLGLSRLRAATDRVTDSEARAHANLLADAGIRIGLPMVTRLKAANARGSLLNDAPLVLKLPQGTLLLRFSDGGTCFNLNSLARREKQAPADASAADFARLLAATGVPMQEADAVSKATAARLSGTAILWADASEWVRVPGVTAAIWNAAGPMLCALPSRDAAGFNINALQPGQWPLLVALGLSPDEARRAISARPPAGWTDAQDFWAAATPGGMPAAAGAAVSGTSSRWIGLSVVAITPEAIAARRVLLDSIRTPAMIASSVWLPPPARDTVLPLIDKGSA